MNSRLSLEIKEKQTLLMRTSSTQTNMEINSTFSLSNFNCRDSTVGVSVITAFLAIRLVIIFPLSLFVLYLGHQRWRLQRSFATTSHSDIFTYHLAAVEFICVLGIGFWFCGQYSGLSELVRVGNYLFAVVLHGEISFHILTCVERYLAVVHPVIYLGLRQSGGVRIRNISIVCVWLLCCGWIVFIILLYPAPVYIPYVCVLIFSIVVVSFCSLSVLCVLIRPRPGEMGGDKGRVDQSKQRAFHTVTAIMGVLWFYFLGYFVYGSVYSSSLLNFIGECVILVFGNVATLPSSLVLPLLFLHRAGKLHCCKSSDK